MPFISAPRVAVGWQRLIIGLAFAGILLAAGWMAWSAWRRADLRARAEAAADRADWDEVTKVLDHLSWYNPNGDLDRSAPPCPGGTRPRRADRRGEAVGSSTVRGGRGGGGARLTQGRFTATAFLRRRGRG